MRRKCRELDYIITIATAALLFIPGIHSTGAATGGLSGSPGGFTAHAAAPTPVPKTATDNYIHVAMKDEPKSLNPVIPNDEWSSKFLDRIWDKTVQTDPDDQSIQPWIATNWWEVGTDHKNFTVTYRFADWQYVYIDKAHTKLEKKPIKFHDNHEVDIYDLLFSFELAMTIPRWSGSFESLDKIPNGTVAPPECTDTTQKIHLIRGISMDADPAKKLYTLHFRLNRTDASWELNYLAMKLYSYHLWSEKFYGGGFGEWMIEDIPDPTYCEVGSGAFKYNTWKKGGQYAQLDTFAGYFPWNKMPRDSTGKAMTLKNYATDWHWETKTSPITVDPSQQIWGEKQARPNIDGIKYHIYYSVDTAIMALQNGDVDVIWWTIDPGYIPALTSNPSMQLVTSEDTRAFYTIFNMRTQCFGYEDWNYPVVDKGKPFRKAFTMCTDKESIVKRLLMNYGTPGSSVVPPIAFEWYNPYVKTYPFDPAGAAAVLDAAGYTIGSSGWRNIGPPIGESEFDLIHPTKDYDSVKYEAARMIVNQLRSIKVNIVSKPLQSGAVIERMNARNFDIISDVSFDVGTNPDLLYYYFHSSQAGCGLNNHPGYHNPSYDSIVDQSRAELNRSHRVELIKQAQGIIAEDIPMDVIYYRSNIEAYRKDRWAGWLKTSGGIMNDWSFKLVHEPMEYMELTIEPREVMTSGRWAPVNILVKSLETASPLTDVNVTIKATAGGLDAGFFGSGSDNGTGMTGYDGLASFTYTAPDVNSSERNRTIWLDVTASKDGYELTRGKSIITVFSDDTKYLYAKFDDAASSTVLKTGEGGILRFSILGHYDNGVPGVNYTINCTPSNGLAFSSMNGKTDDTGMATLHFSANLAGNYTVWEIPEKPQGYSIAYSDSIRIMVLNNTAVKIPDITPWHTYLGFTLIIACAVALPIIYIIWKKRKKRK